MFSGQHISKAPIVKLKEDTNKIVSALAYVIELAQENGKKASQYELVKTLFLADRQHLNEWGRLITFDNYVAMNHGPVPSLAFDILKETAKGLSSISGKRPPWKRREEQLGNSKYYIYYDATKVDFEQFLSDSDLDCLKRNLNVVQTLGFSQIRKLTHEDAAYVDAWDDISSRRQFPMSLGMLFDTPNFDKALELAEISSFA